MATASDFVKRIFLGRQMASHHLEHTLLPKVLALPVFSSDALSSVAYATEEMMLVLALAGAGALSLTFPIGLVVAVVLAIVVTSYRQTVKAYPHGGGSYIVAKDNLGTIPGLVAAAAILQDYTLTVAVSVTAGTIAVVSAVPGLEPHSLTVALSFVAIIMLANLRGVKEAGVAFAIPTYGFVLTVYVTLGFGLVRCLAGCPVAASSTLPLHPEIPLSLFIILRAFASGSTALTGVEAIADGVQAFRRPQSKNAAKTLAIMGVISVSMFLGITLLAQNLGIRVSEHIPGKSVLAQIGETIYGSGAMFYVLQVFTALILILAANTAFQDFPRLSAILARDKFMPGQFRNRGDRLVFSNGIIVLSLFAGLLVWAFDANLTSLIQLYVVGVFTAFTLSQAGMVRRWFKLRGPGWVQGATINGIGMFATGVVLVIVAITKFGKPPAPGAWIVIAAMPVVVLLLLSISRHYLAVAEQLKVRDDRIQDVGANRVVFVITDLDAAVTEALGYVKSFRPQELHPVYVGNRPQEEVHILWEAISRGGPQVEFPQGRNRVKALLEYVRGMERAEHEFVTVVVPELFRKRSLLAAVRRPITFRLKLKLLREPQVVVTDVPVLVKEGHLVGVDARPLVPEKMVALVFVSSVNDASLRAIRYARSLRAAETRGVYVALEAEGSGEILEAWAAAGIPIPLDIVDAPFRDLGPPVLEEVRRATADGRTVAAVVMPELIVKRHIHRLLHNTKSLFIKRMLLFEPRVILSSVPFQLK